MFAPLATDIFVKSNITSPFGMRNGRLHKGVDVRVPIGNPIYAILDGKVSLNRADSHHPKAEVGYGWYLIVDHANGLQSLYAHLDERPGLAIGETVYAGQTIGKSGSSGSSTGPHLHFEIRQDRQAVDPLPFFPHLFGNEKTMDEILTTEQLFERIRKFNWTRSVTKLHPHHTYKPKKADYNGNNGARLNQNMRNYHINTRGFSDIAQHLTLLPDGLWVVGRDWNRIPASMTGNNSGAFMVEMVGDFHSGHESLEGKQLAAILDWVVFCMDFFKVPESGIHFHREYSATACPGSSIEKSWFLEQVQLHRNKPQPSPQIIQNQYFSDMLNSHPHIYGVNSLWEKGILKGYWDGRLIPDQPLLRVELVTLIGRALRYITNFYMKKDLTFSKYEPMPGHWAQRYVGAAEQIGILEEYFSPYETVESAYIAGKMVDMVNWLFESKMVEHRVDFVGSYGEFWLHMAKKSDIGNILQKFQTSRVEGVAIVAHALNFIINEYLGL